jgi:hypothetical protein
VIATLAHNLLRFLAAIGLGALGGAGGGQDATPGPAQPAGRITRSARRWRLHLPAGWPWAAWFELALARLRCLPYAT